MTKKEILKAVFEGKKMREVGWEVSNYLLFDEETLAFFDEYATYNEDHINYFLEYGKWEEYIPEPKFKIGEFVECGGTYYRVANVLHNCPGYLYTLAQNRLDWVNRTASIVSKESELRDLL